MFNKTLKERIARLEEKFDTQMDVNANAIRFEDHQLKINEGVIRYEEGQARINKLTLAAIEALNEKVQLLTARVEILEKKLEEKGNEQPSFESSDGCVDRMVIYGPN